MRHISIIGAVLAIGTSAHAEPKYKCMKGMKIKEAYKATSGDWEIQNGLSVAKRSGNVNRAKLKVKGCKIEATPGDQFLIGYDAKHEKTLGRSLDFEMQCVDASKPNGKFLGYDVAPNPSKADMKSWTPPCEAKGLNKLEKKACSKGMSNRDRINHFKAAAKKKKRFYLDMYVIERPGDYARKTESLVSGARSRNTAAEVAPSGKLFCQYYHKPSKQVLFVTTFDIPATK